MPEIVKVAKGLENVVVDKTAIATTSSAGDLLYRGYKAIDLAEKKSFEDTAFLIVNGKLPTDGEASRFASSIQENMQIDPSVREIMKINRESDVMRNIRSMISLYPYREKDTRKLFLKMDSIIPQLSSDTMKAFKGEPFQDSSVKGYSAKFYSLITGGKTMDHAASFQKLMILYMEHEFNAFTFALRVAASTLADPVSAVCAALATLKGPLHGGANSEVLEYLGSINSREEARKYVDEKVQKSEKIMGFGHRVYKKRDPRAQFVKGELKKIAPDYPLFQAAEAVEDYLWEKKNLPANVDLYAAILMKYLGIEESFYLPVFAASRIYGWNAHYFEQVENNKIIRPAAEYIGPENLTL